MGQRDAIEAVAGIAAGQWGMFTTAQAAGLGVSRAEVARLVSRGVARRLRHGVHIMEGAPSGALEIVRAEWLATDPARTAGERRGDADPVVVSHETAAQVYEIGDLPSGGVHLTSPGRLRTRQQWVTIHQQALSPKEYQWIEGLPVTTPRRTLEDIAMSGRWEASHLRTLAEDALNQGLLPASESFRAVAAESGWSLGAVQKAFASKALLDAAVLQRLRETSVAIPPGEPGRPTLRAWLVELMLAVLPLDESRREATLRGAAFADRAAFDESIGRVIAEGDEGIRSLVARLVRRAQSEDEVRAGLDPDHVAWAFLALATGAATQLLYDTAPEPVVRARIDAAIGGLLGGH
jgi:hypothetical protein